MMHTEARILVVDDEKNCLRAIKDVLELEKIPCLTADSATRALYYLERYDIDIVLTDVKMPKNSGMELVRKIKSQNNDTYVIMMTGYASIQDAVEAMKLGAYQYIMKPIIMNDLLVQIHEIFEKIDKSPQQASSDIISGVPAGKALLGNTERIKNIGQLISKIANTDLPVLILGESGTGKELAATAIHYAGERARKNFVPINCAALPDTLLESELFGYRKGAFTDARNSKIGKFAQADGGTLFLDEIGDMKPSMQVKLLRVLEEKEYHPLGSDKSIKVDFRLISATNKDINDILKDGSFRSDLYYRLNAVQISMPPLREIPQDIPLLARHFADEFAHKYNLKKIKISQAIINMLQSYSWPGNVRELANTIRRSIALCDGSELKSFDLPQHIIDPESTGPESPSEQTSLKLSELEKQHIQYVLHLANSNKSLAANMLGIHRDTLLRKLKRYEIKE
ncbi:response regulator [candidate division KSB1 bacterium]|nr:response regulator [candidate division KSB1 bacterium]